MSDLTVRPASPADYPAIARLTLAAYRADGQVQPGHPYEQILTDVARRAGAGDLLVAELDGQVVGSVLFVRPGSPYSELAGGGEAEFRMLAVDPAAQRRGVGAALTQACLDRAATLGCAALVLYVRDFTVASQRLYERLGFSRTPDRDWTPMSGVNLLAMRLDLPREQQWTA